MINTLEKWVDRKRELNPFRDFLQFQGSLNQLFDEFTNWKKVNGIQEFSFSPSCEISEENNCYILIFDLPGVNKDEIKVEADTDRLTVYAERKEEKKSESKKKYLSEVYYGSYSRSFALPSPVDAKKIDAKFDNGVLTITIPKTELANTKQISIH